MKAKVHIVRNFTEFSRYCLAGGLAFIVDFTVFLLFVEQLNTNYIISNTAGFVAGIFVNYLISIGWVFSHRSYSRVTPEFFIFIIIGIGGVLFGNLNLWIFVEYFYFEPVHAKYLVTAIVLLFNYSMRKSILFRTPAVTNE
jgi:putative flippase GtrA